MFWMNNEKISFFFSCSFLHQRMKCLIKEFSNAVAAAACTEQSIHLDEVFLYSVEKKMQTNRQR